MRDIKQMHPLLRLVLSATLFVVVLMGLQSVFASVRKVKRVARLESNLQKSEFSIVLFYYRGKRVKDKTLRKKVREQLRNFKSASKTTPYRYAGVSFFSVDVAINKDFLVFANKLRVMPRLDNPTVALFRGNKQVSSKNGFLSKSDITDFIDKYLGKEIDKIVDEKDRKLVREKQDAKRRAYERSYRYPSWGGYYGYGWPYRYSRPGWGLGFGWGGGWRGGGWRGGRRRCHRCY